MRLTFAVECQPHWFLPAQTFVEAHGISQSDGSFNVAEVAPVEGRIATALAENMEAIRDFVEERLEHVTEARLAIQIPVLLDLLCEQHERAETAVGRRTFCGSSCLLVFLRRGLGGAGVQARSYGGHAQKHLHLQRHHIMQKNV